MSKRLVKSDSDGFLDAKIKGVHDESLIHREIYNPNSFDIIFTRDKTKDPYVLASKIPLGPEKLICKSEDWVHLPHAHFIPTAVNGCELFNVVQNFGDAIGKGNKLPSLPIIDNRSRNYKM